MSIELLAVLVGALRDLLEFAFVVLAAWRVTSLLVREDGPFDIFERLRFALGVRYNDMSAPFGTNVVSEALVCTWCSSVWMGLLAAPFTPYCVSFRSFILTALAISTLIIWIDKRVI